MVRPGHLLGSEHGQSQQTHVTGLPHRKEAVWYQSSRRGMQITSQMIDAQQMSAYCAWQYEYRSNKTQTLPSRVSFPPIFFLFFFL